MMSLTEKDYPKYLAMAYYAKTGRKLNLRHPKTLNEKIQWLKLYDNLPIKTQLADKVLVRGWIKEKIGEEYLKPVLWIGDKFDNIPFDKLPDSFIIKCNHGCKWHVLIKDKNKFLENKFLVKTAKEKIDNWLLQSFFGWSDFETQYKNIEPKIIIEEFLKGNNGGILVWCANSQTFIDSPGEELEKEALSLSKVLAQGFKFVRVDWMIYKQRLYFEEMTFTPVSGFFPDDVLAKDFYKNLSKNVILK